MLERWEQSVLTSHGPEGGQDEDVGDDDEHTDGADDHAQGHTLRVDVCARLPPPLQK